MSLSYNARSSTTGPPGSYARLKHMTTLSFGFREPLAYGIAKEVLKDVDRFLCGEVDYLDMNSMLEECIKDVIKSVRDN